MKLEEKLMKLRKEHAWSQEEFAEKLDVTRQTISKWELGQTVPDTENLTKIANIFGVTVNDLLDNDNDPISSESRVDDGNKGPLKISILVIVLILIIFGIGVIAVNKMFSIVKTPLSIMNKGGQIANRVLDKFDEFDELENEVFSNNKISNNIVVDNEKVEQQVDSYKVRSFNSTFKNLYYGTTDGFFMTDFIDNIIKSNEENPNNIISVSFKGKETNDFNELREIKKELNRKSKYEIYYEYDKDGFIIKANVTEL